MNQKKSIKTTIEYHFPSIPDGTPKPTTMAQIGSCWIANEAQNER